MSYENETQNPADARGIVAGIVLVAVSSFALGVCVGVLLPHFL